MGSRGHDRRNYDEIFQKSHHDSESNRYIYSKSTQKRTQHFRAGLEGKMILNPDLDAILIQKINMVGI